jgi:hypothetical protein
MRERCEDERHFANVFLTLCFVLTLQRHDPVGTAVFVNDDREEPTSAQLDQLSYRSRVARMGSLPHEIRSVMGRHGARQEVDLGTGQHDFLKHPVGSAEPIGQRAPLFGGELLMAADQIEQLLLTDLVCLRVRVDGRVRGCVLGQSTNLPVTERQSNLRRGEESPTAASSSAGCRTATASRSSPALNCHSTVGGRRPPEHRAAAFSTKVQTPEADACRRP